MSALYDMYLCNERLTESLSFWGQVQSVPGPWCCVFQEAGCRPRSRHLAARYSLPERPATTHRHFKDTHVALYHIRDITVRRYSNIVNFLEALQAPHAQGG